MGRGFTLVELLLALAIVGVLVAISVPLVQEARLRSEISDASSEAEVVYAAFKQHYVDMDAYPLASSDSAFRLDSFEPLRSLGYYNGSIATQLLGGRADAYDSPDDRGQNREFWLEMTLAADSTIRLLVADSDDAPLSAGEYVNGVYLYRNGKLVEIHGVN